MSGLHATSYKGQCTESTFADFRGREALRKFGELCLRSVPYFYSLEVGPNQLLQMRGHGVAIHLQPGPGCVDALCDVEDDAGEAIFVDVNFLVARYLANLAVRRQRQLCSNSKPS
jgi:hypothetical protein